MSDELELEPMAPEIAALLAREKAAPYDPDAKARLARRLELAAIGGAAAVGVGLAAAPIARSALATKIAIGSLLVLGGGGVGAALAMKYGSPTAHVAAPAPIPSVAAPSSPSASVEAPVPVVDVTALPSSSTAAAKPSVSVASSSSPSTSLGEEQQILDTARSAVNRGAYAVALGELGDHARRFPNGRLAEERELLYVQALAGAGRSDEAAARARAFEQRYPRSIFLPAVRAASSAE